MITQSELKEMEEQLDKKYIPFVFDKVRDRITTFLENYKRLPQVEQEEIRSRFGPQHGNRLLYFAWNMAECAVREQSAKDVELGLLAVAFEGTRRERLKEISTLCMLYHSAQK
ncbi:MAG: hypothetical protein ABSG31_18775, partial [Tepidisphaeraceae bacterium]